MVGTMKMRLDENATNKINQVKKLVAPTADNTKRAALGDLQNRGVLPTFGAKDAALKELKDVKPQNIRTTKARVDSHWSKVPPTGSNNGATTKSSAADAPRILRSNLVRTGSGTTARTAPGMHRYLSSDLPQPKTTVTNAKLVEQKKQKVIEKPTLDVRSKNSDKTTAGKVLEVTCMRREDSNLSRKSLTKLREVLANDAGGAAKSYAAVGKTTGAVVKTSTAVGKPTAAVGKATAAACKPTAAIKPIAAKSHSTSNLATGIKKEAGATKTELLPATKSSTKSMLKPKSKDLKDLKAVENIDADDAENLVLVSEYVNDIYNYLNTLEIEHSIRPDHLSAQLEVHSKMRAVLVDWMNEVHLQFQMAPETFHMAVAIVDRYLQAVTDTKRPHLQLVGVTSLFIATKYEELFPPAISDFVYITDDTYTAKEIRLMELQILKKLDFNLSRPLSIQFLRRYSKAANAEDSHHAMSKYFLELAAVEYELASYKPSEIAAASIFLALHLLNGNHDAPTGFDDKHWTPTLEWYSHYKPEHLRPIAKIIAVTARNAPQAKLKSVYHKYQSTKLQKISLRSELYGALMDSIINNKD